MTTSPDIVFVGAGLANVLAALRLSEVRPATDWVMVEAGDCVGGAAFERTWSFHASDLTEDSRWAENLATHSWDRHSVAFPGRTREIAGRYFSVRSRALHELAARRFGDRLLLNAPARQVGPGAVRLVDGRVIEAGLVVDGRGSPEDRRMPCGFQKFVGLNLKLAEPHGLRGPVLMDTLVDQSEGLRFVYVLPWTDRDVLVEDTYYANGPEIDEEEVVRRVRDYVEARGWVVAHEGERERGVLPIPLAGDFEPGFVPGVAASGLRSGRFHPTTGYSFAAAVRFAGSLARVSRFDEAAAESLNAESRRIWRRGDFLRRLNNMLFLAAEPGQRRQIMAQFYGRDLELISKFYRGDLSRLDQLKLLSGRPPISVTKGLAAFVERVGSVNA